MPKLPNLKRVRGEYPLTIRELAEKSGVSHDTITKVENGHRAAQPRTVRKLAAALGVAPKELMGVEE
jgi:transcriptional regulator with XRE-family HTH domain